VKLEVINAGGGREFVFGMRKCEKAPYAAVTVHLKAMPLKNWAVLLGQKCGVTEVFYINYVLEPNKLPVLVSGFSSSGCNILSI